MIELSVVLISKNQAWNISRLIESVLDGTSGVSEKEVILVDSASTDETVQLASRYPVTILRLHPDQRLSPAIGRYVGYKHTKGEYVLFLDGDMELLRGWVDCALRAMRATPHAGIAMSSSVIGMPRSAARTDYADLPCGEAFGQPKVTWQVSFAAGGAALYRRSVLELVGPFNPYLYSEEEPELCLRIRRAGYLVLLYDQPIVRHYDDALLSVSSVLGRRRRNFHLGMGQAARYHFGTKLFWRWLIERWWEPSAALLFVSGLVSLLLSFVLGNVVYLAFWLLGLALLIVVLSLRKRSLRAAVVAAFNWVIMAEGFLRGFLRKPKPPTGFNAKMETVRAIGNQPAALSAVTVNSHDFSTSENLNGFSASRN